MSPKQIWQLNGDHSLNLQVKVQSWGWAFELKYDSLPCLDFKEVFCIEITDPPVAQLAYKIEHQPPRVGFEPSVNGEIARITIFLLS
jgi:hypothetical protein